MEYIKLAKKTAVPPGIPRCYSLFGKKIALLSKGDGSYQAIEATCKHQGADLTTGIIKNNVAVCPRHQWEYDLQTGECLNHDSLPLRKYAVKVEGDNILVSTTPVDE